MSGATKSDPELRAHPGSVIGVAIGLLVLLSTVATLAMRLGASRGESDAELLAAILPAPRPFGLDLIGGAILPSGDRVLRLAPAVLADGPVDAPATAPATIVEVLLTLPRSAREVGRILGGEAETGMEAARRIAAWERDPESDELIEVARGDVEWRGWRAPYVRRRALKAGGDWSEATAVNLSTPQRNLVLTVLWTPETAESERDLAVVLAGVTLEPAAAEPPVSAASSGN